MKYLEYVMKMQAIAKVGLKYSKDEYAIENYLEVQELSKRMLEELVDTNIDKDNYYERDLYPTPNVSVRVLVFKDNKLLFVKEISEQKYSLPGGWCDVFVTSKENAIAEAVQESGYIVEIDRLLGVFNRNYYKEDISTVSEYMIAYSAHIVGGEAKTSHETDEVSFFDLDNLPILSTKISQKELDIMLEVYQEKREPYFD